MKSNHLLRRILLILLATMALAACNRREAGTAATSNTTPVAGGELVFAFDGTALSSFGLDAHKASFAPHHRVIRSIYDSLVVLRPNHQVAPWLARSWEVSADGKAYTFKLREDVTFHDGTRFDAQALKFNLDRIKEPKNALMSAADLGPYDSSEVVDAFTLRVKLSEPFSPLLVNLSKSSLGIVSPTAVQLYGDRFVVNPVGTGPFKFVSQTPGTEIVLARNADYRWAPEGATHTGPAWLDKLTIKNVPEEATRVAVLQNGQAGAADIIPPQNLLALRQDPAYRIVQGELLNHNYALYLNVQREPWRDDRVRQAFKLALDLDAAVRTVHLGTLPRAWAPLSPGILGYDKSFEHSWKPDPAAARRTLDELGWKLPAGAAPGAIREKDGKRLTLAFLESQGNREKRLDIITVLRRQLADVGFDLKVETVASGNYLERVASGEYDLLGGSLFAPDPDVLRRIHSPHQRSRGSASKVDDPELQRLLDAGRQEHDPERRTVIYREAQRLILDKTYSIPVYVLTYFIATQARVQGVAIDAHGFPDFHGAWVAQP